MADQTPQVARNRIASDALRGGIDPAKAMIEHDEVMDAEFDGRGKLLKPTWEEKVAGADADVIAGHRYGATLESIEVQTTMKSILAKADELKLADNALAGLSAIVAGFVPNSDQGQTVTTREFLAAAKLIFQIHTSAREFSIKRMSAQQTGPIPIREAPATPEEAVAQLADSNDRIIHLNQMLAETS